MANMTRPTAKAPPKGNATKECSISILLNPGTETYSRLPMLEIICDKFVRLASNSLRNYTADMVDVRIMGLRSTRFGEYMETAPERIISIFKSEALSNIGLLAVESKLVYAFVDILFGGRKVPPVLKVEERPFTSIEIGMVRSISEILLADLSNSFEQVISLHFDLDRIETNHKFAMVLRPEDAIAVIDLEVALDQRAGGLSILLPYITLDPIKKMLAKSYVGNQGQKDPLWMRHIEGEINKSKIKLEVRLNGTGIMVGEVADLVVGKTIVLDKFGDHPWDVLINKIKVGKAELGRIGDNVAITLVSEGIRIIPEAEK